MVLAASALLCQEFKPGTFASWSSFDFRKLEILFHFFVYTPQTFFLCPPPSSSIRQSFFRMRLFQAWVCYTFPWAKPTYPLDSAHLSVHSSAVPWCFYIYHAFSLFCPLNLWFILYFRISLALLQQLYTWVLPVLNSIEFSLDGNRW